MRSEVPAYMRGESGTEMNRVFAYSLRLVYLCPLLLLLFAGPVLAQTETPAASPTAELPAASPTIEPPAATPALTAMPSLAATTTPGSISSTPAPTQLPDTSPLIAPPTVPLPTATATTTPPASDIGGLLASDGLVPLLLGGLLLLAGLAIVGLLLLRRRRPARLAPTGGRAATVPLSVGAEQVTGVLVPVYLELESDPSQRFSIHETPFAIGRDPGNQLVIDETFPQWQTVSREHALISRHARGYVIEDLGSQNGVRVNGRLTPKNLLRTGWQVTIGGVVFRFVDETQTN